MSSLRAASLAIAAGAWKGRRITAAAGVRPTSALVREALMSSWAAALAGSRFLDLFAGSGAVALEALSRGASSAVCVERDPTARKVLRDNARLLSATIELLDFDLPREVGQLAAAVGEAFDCVFADPPYDFLEWPALLAGVAPLVAAAGEVGAEHSSRVSLPPAAGRLVQVRSRRYGESALTFYRGESD